VVHATTVKLPIYGVKCRSTPLGKITKNYTLAVVYKKSQSVFDWGKL